MPKVSISASINKSSQDAILKEAKKHSRSFSSMLEILAMEGLKSIKSKGK